MKIFAFCCFVIGVLALYGAPSDNPNLPFLYFLTVVSFIVFSGKFFLNLVKQKISSLIAERKEEKEFQKQLRRKAQEEEALGRARNKAHIELIGAQTRALIEQMKAGEQVQNQLLSKYHEINAMGDNTFNDMKKEIEKMSSNPKMNFNL